MSRLPLLNPHHNLPNKQQAEGLLGSKAGAEAMEDFFPAELDGAANGLIDAAIKLCKERLPKDDLSVFKIEEMIAVAAENSPVANPVLLALREAFDEVKAQYQAALADEKDQVRCGHVCLHV